MSSEFFETIPGQPHTTVHSRVFEHPGAVVDVGCLGYDWCRAFIGKKRVIGADPDLSVKPIDGVELVSTQIGPYTGVVAFQGASSVDAPNNGPQSAIWSWRRFCKLAINDKGIAILKLNIEGGEWPLLASMSEEDFSQIDQIAVSFHDFVWPGMAKASAAVRFYLRSLGYKEKPIYEPFSWYLFY